MPSVIPSAFADAFMAETAPSRYVLSPSPISALSADTVAAGVPCLDYRWLQRVIASDTAALAEQFKLPRLTQWKQNAMYYVSGFIANGVKKMVDCCSWREALFHDPLACDITIIFLSQSFCVINNEVV